MIKIKELIILPKSRKFIYKNIRVERLPRQGVLYRITLGIFALVCWVCIFCTGLTINSAVYRAAIALDYYTWLDLVMVIFTFTPTNVGILAAFAGLIGGVSSNLSANNYLQRIWLIEVTTPEQANCLAKDYHVKITKKNSNDTTDAVEVYELTSEERRMFYLTERPMVSMIRGFMVYLIFVAGSYITSFSDISTVSNTEPISTTDTTLIKKGEIRLNSVTATVDSIKTVREESHLYPKNSPESIFLKKTESRLRRKLDKDPYISNRDNIAGLSISSYFKFAITVSLLAFIVGYDPSRFDGLLNKFNPSDKR